MLCAVYLHFCSSSTFKDPERASLRDSGHGDSDQADSDQDTNKGSCCDMSAKEALKLKATGVKPPPLEQGESSLGLLCIYKKKTMKQQPVFPLLWLFVLSIELAIQTYTWLLRPPPNHHSSFSLLCSLCTFHI